MRQPKTEFARLLVANDQQLRRYIMLLLPRRDDVEEVLQRTAMVLWEKFSDYDPSRDFLPWATRVAYFEVLNFRKEIARSRLVYSEEAIAAIAQTREELASELDERRAVLTGCLAKLKRDDQLLLERRYCESMTVKSLADESGKTVKALYRRLDRIRDMIQTCVERSMNLPKPQAQESI